MIKLSRDLEGFYTPCPSLAYTLCLKAAFEGGPLESEVWTAEEYGKTTAVISRYGNRLYITAKSDFGEIKDFINIVGFEDIFCTEDTADALGLKVTEEFNILHLKKAESALDYTPAVRLYDLYNALNTGSDGDVKLPSFETFAPDVSHRLRHSAALGFAEEYGGAYAVKSENCAIISGISVKPERRGCGYGSKLLSRLVSHLSGDIFALTGDKNTEFYVKNGFSLKGKAVISKP